MSVSNTIKAQMGESSWIRKMFEEGNKLRSIHGNEKVFDLSLGNPLLEPPSSFKDKLIEILENEPAGSHRYMPNGGFTDVRDSIARNIRGETGINFEGNDILMSIGAAGGMNVILRSILDPGDEVVIIAPYFAEYKFYIQHNNGKVIETQCDDKWCPDLESLRNAMTNRTKAVIINSPNNPTGVIYNSSIIQSIAEILKKCEQQYGNDIYLISDEPYRKLIYTNVKYPFIYDYYTHSIGVTSHSKDLGLAGERIGYISVNPADENRSTLMDALTFSMRTLGFVNAPALMQKVVSQLQETTVDISVYQKKRDYLYSKLIDIGYDCVLPEGAFYLFPKSPIASDEDFVKNLQDNLVLVVPGSGFGKKGYFRISYCVEDSVLEGSIKGFAKVFQYYKNES